MFDWLGSKTYVRFLCQLSIIQYGPKEFVDRYNCTKYIVHVCMLIGTIVDMYLRRLSWTWAPAKHFGITFIIYTSEATVVLAWIPKLMIKCLVMNGQYLFKIDPLEEKIVKWILWSLLSNSCVYTTPMFCSICMICRMERNVCTYLL